MTSSVISSLFELKPIELPPALFNGSMALFNGSMKDVKVIEMTVEY